MCHAIGSLDLRPPCSAHHHHHHHQQLRHCQNQCTVKLSIALTWTSSLRMKTPWWVKYTHSHTTVWCVFLFYVSQCSIFLFFFLFTLNRHEGGQYLVPDFASRVTVSLLVSPEEKQTWGHCFCGSKKMETYTALKIRVKMIEKWFMIIDFFVTQETIVMLRWLARISSKSTFSFLFLVLSYPVVLFRVLLCTLKSLQCIKFWHLSLQQNLMWHHHSMASV